MSLPASASSIRSVLRRRGGRHRQDRAETPTRPTELTKTEPGSAQLEIVLIDRTMILRGEIDISNYDVLADAGRKLAARCTDRLGEAVIDAAGLSFIDAGGLDTLVSLSSSLSSVGSRLRIIHASGPLRRVSGICGLDATLGLESTGSRPHLDRASTS